MTWQKWSASRQRGTVLPLVLCILAFSALVLLRQERLAQVRQGAWQHVKDTEQARWLARIGETRLRYALAGKGGTVMRAEELSALCSRALREIQPACGSLLCTVEDETGKFPLAQLRVVPEQQFWNGTGFAGVGVRLVQEIGARQGFPVERRVAVRAIRGLRDWIDLDTSEAEVRQGPESDWLTAQGETRPRPNANLRALNELQLVPELSPVRGLWTHAEAAALLSSLVTLSPTGGRINVQTAPDAVLVALFRGKNGREYGKKLCSARRQSQNSDWYSDFFEAHPDARTRWPSGFVREDLRCVRVRVTAEYRTVSYCLTACYRLNSLSNMCPELLEIYGVAQATQEKRWSSLHKKSRERVTSRSSLGFR